MNRRALIQLVAIATLLCSQLVFAQNAATAVVPVNIAPISSGASSTCAIRSSDDLYCVGTNSFGQLGNGTNTSTSDPQKVVGISNVVSVSVGNTTACAINRLGQLFCWGENSVGQLGIADTVNRNVATRITGLNNVVNVAVGQNFACALNSSGSVYCWGANEFGQLGTESKIGSNVPVLITSAPSGISKLSANGKRVCVVADEVYCWGGFESFVFPNESRNWVPTKVAGSAGALDVSLGADFGCLTFSTSISCWGSNDHGQLGNGSKVQSSSLVSVNGITNVSQIATGDHFACATDTNKDTYCWGQNSSGQLGIAAGVDQPTRIPNGASSSPFIAAGANNLCALKISGDVICVGDSSQGQSGLIAQSSVPLTNASAANLTKVSAGADTTCAINNAGLLQCWGALVPVLLDGLSFSDVSVGNVSACAVTTLRKVLCWGSNSAGQLGDDSNRAAISPVQVANSTANFIKVSVGYRHACAITADGLVYCWGDNSHQQLGSISADSKIPKVVPGIASATDLSVGDYHSCVKQSGGNLTCWGDNSKKQINNSASKLLTPIDLVLASPVLKFSLGGYNTCVLSSAKALQCFGDNAKKQSPGAVSGTYDSVSSGSGTVCALSTDSKIWCLGSAESGKLGSVGVNTSTPTQASSTLAASISVGDMHACAITTTGSLACWGSNDSGQLASSYGFPDAFAKATVVISGTTAIGESLTTYVSGTEPAVSFTYLWKRSAQVDGAYASLSSQTKSTLELSNTDFGRYFTVEIWQSKWGITSAGYLSKPVGPVGSAIRLLVTPTPLISGINKVGKLLTARAGHWDAGVKLSYQWFRGKTAIKSATKVTYKIGPLDLGQQISVSVTGSKNSLAKVTVKSSKTAKVIR